MHRVSRPAHSFGARRGIPQGGLAWPLHIAIVGAVADGESPEGPIPRIALARNYPGRTALEFPSMEGGKPFFASY